MGFDIPYQYNNIAETALRGGFHIIRNGSYNVCNSTAQRFPCLRCVQDM